MVSIDKVDYCTSLSTQSSISPTFQIQLLFQTISNIHKNEKSHFSQLSVLARDKVTEVATKQIQLFQ